MTTTIEFDKTGKPKKKKNKRKNSPEGKNFKSKRKPAPQPKKPKKKKPAKKAGVLVRLKKKSVTAIDKQTKSKTKKK